MLRHIALFTWAEGTTEEQVRVLGARLAELPRLIPQLKAFSFGPNAGINKSGYDFAVVADFADRESYLVYRDHPDHRAVIEECIVPIRDGRASIQYDLG